MTRPRLEQIVATKPEHSCPLVIANVDLGHATLTRFVRGDVIRHVQHLAVGKQVVGRAVPVLDWLSVSKRNPVAFPGQQGGQTTRTGYGVPA
jgi:hypothetical protein